MKITGKDVATIKTGRNGTTEKQSHLPGGRATEYTITFVFTDGTESSFMGTAAACLRQLDYLTPSREL